MKDTDIKKLINETIDKAHKCDALLEENERLKKELGKQEDKPWPKNGDEYWHTNSLGSADSETWLDDNVDRYSLASGNCHRTEEQAKAYRDWLTSPRTQARRMVEMCDEFNPGGRIGIRYDDLKEEVYIYEEPSEVIDWEGGLNFRGVYKASAALDKLGEDLIKVALGVITGEEAERIVMESMSRG